jgi:hypothetical protein
MLPACLGSFSGGGSCPLVGGGPASIDLVGATLLLVKHPLDGFVVFAGSGL